MLWSAASSTSDATTAGSGYRGISRGTRNRRLTTSVTSSVSFAPTERHYPCASNAVSPRPKDSWSAGFGSDVGCTWSSLLPCRCPRTASSAPPHGRQRRHDEQHRHREVEDDGHDGQEGADDGGARLCPERGPPFGGEALQLLFSGVIDREPGNSCRMPDQQVQHECGQHQVDAEHDDRDPFSAE